VTKGAVTPDKVRESQTLRLAVQQALSGGTNALIIARQDGPGALYYTARLNLALPASEAKAEAHGISLRREFFLANGPTTPVTSARLGDVITVRLTINVAEDVYYFALEDRFPAGMEPIDPALLTAGMNADQPGIRQVSRGNPYWYWGWWYFKHIELRDSQSNLYADFLPHGTYVYTYQVQATVAGTFQAMPAYAYTFYAPEIYGRSDGALFHILSGQEAEPEPF
jgi:uncharacterized protein YfaS (alpha-2-macroglobulin family)